MSSPAFHGLVVLMYIAMVLHFSAGNSQNYTAMVAIMSIELDINQASSKRDGDPRLKFAYDIR